MSINHDQIYRCKEAAELYRSRLRGLPHTVGSGVLSALTGAAAGHTGQHDLYPMPQHKRQCFRGQYQ